MRNVLITLLFCFNCLVGYSQVVYTVDRTITGFVHQDTLNSRIMYTENGMPEDIYAFFPHFQLYPFDADWETSKQIIDKAIANPKQGTTTFSDCRQQELFFEDYKVRVLQCKAHKKTLQTSVYYAYIIKGEKCLLFIGADTADGKYGEKYEQTIRSVRF